MISARTCRTHALFLAWILLAAWGSAAVAAPPTRRVVACYFHRTVRCPTCQKVGSSVEAAVRSGFAAELADGRLEWRMMDFQEQQNASLVAALRITGPTFIIMDVQDNRVVSWKPAPKAWSLLGDQAALCRYVQAEVRSVLSGRAAAVK